MPTIKISKTPGSRIHSGNAIIEAASTANVKPIKVKFENFKKAHSAYVTAEDVVEKADHMLRAAEAMVGAADDIQDQSVNDLASALIGDGLPRTQPFKPFGFQAPSVIEDLRYALEAKTVKELVVKVLLKKGLGTKSIAAAKAARAAALAVEAALKPIEGLKKMVAAARSRRDALGQPWETSLAALKRAARSAEDDEAKGIYAVLFESTAKAPKPAKPKTPKTPKVLKAAKVPKTEPKTDEELAAAGGKKEK